MMTIRQRIFPLLVAVIGSSGCADRPTGRPSPDQKPAVQFDVKGHDTGYRNKVER